MIDAEITIGALDSALKFRPQSLKGQNGTPSTKQLKTKFAELRKNFASAKNLKPQRHPNSLNDSSLSFNMDDSTVELNPSDFVST